MIDFEYSEQKNDAAIKAAEAHGAKFERSSLTKPRMWVILDQPNVLWFAHFSSKANAAQAYCFQHGIKL